MDLPHIRQNGVPSVKAVHPPFLMCIVKLLRKVAFDRTWLFIEWLPAHLPPIQNNGRLWLHSDVPNKLLFVWKKHESG